MNDGSGPKLVNYPELDGEVGVTDTLHPHGWCRRYGATTDATLAASGANNTAISNMLTSITAVGLEAVTDIPLVCAGPVKLPSGTRHRHIGQGSWNFEWELTTDVSGGSCFVENDSTTSGNADMELHNLTIKGPWADDGGPFGEGRMLGSTFTPPATGFHLRRVDGVRVFGTNITNIPGIAFGYQGVKNFKFNNVYISRCGRDGLTGWWYGVGWNCENGEITGVTCDRVGDDGIAIHASAGELPNTDVRPRNIIISGARVSGWETPVNGAATVSMTSGSATVTSTLTAFASVDVGKTFYVPGAGAGGAALTTYIRTYVSPTQITLGVAASTSVSSVAAVFSAGAGRGLVLDGVEQIEVDILIDRTFAQGCLLTNDGTAGSSGFRSQHIRVTGKVMRAGTTGNVSQPQVGCYIASADYCTTNVDVFGSYGKGYYVTDALHPKITGDVIGNGTVITDYGVDLDGITSTGNVIHARVFVRCIANKGGGLRSRYAPYSHIDGEFIDNGQAGTGTDANGAGIIHSGDHAMIIGDVVVRDTRASGSRTQTCCLSLSNVGGTPILIMTGGTYQNAAGGNNIQINNPNTKIIRRGVWDQSTSNVKLLFDQDMSGVKNFSGTGSPESAVTGNVGDRYFRTDGAAGTWLYFKESGTGNTGWVARV